MGLQWSSHRDGNWESVLHAKPSQHFDWSDLCFLSIDRQHSLGSPVLAAEATLSVRAFCHCDDWVLSDFAIASFRQQLRAALQGQQRHILFEQATPAIKGDLRYIFDAIDRDRSGFLSNQELATHLHQAGKVLSEGELTYLFNCMDREEMAVVRSTLRNLAN